MSSLDQLEFDVPLSYQGMCDFLEVVGLDFTQFQINTQESSPFDQNFKVKIDVSRLPSVKRLDNNGQPTCVVILTNLLTEMCNLVQNSGGPDIRLRMSH